MDHGEMRFFSPHVKLLGQFNDKLLNFEVIPGCDAS